MPAGRMLAGKSLFSRKGEFHPEKNEVVIRFCYQWNVKLRPPPCANPPEAAETSIIYDEFSLSGSVDYTLDADRSRLRLSTGCPMQIYIKSPTADTLVGYAPIDHDIQSSHKGQC